MQTQNLKTTCCIAGGGPAGMMLGILLARAGVPAGAANPVVSTDTSRLTQATPWLDKEVAAAAAASELACSWVRAMDAVRAASLAADSTAWFAMATRPAKKINPTNSMKAGTPMTVSMTAEPRSRSPRRMFIG